MTFVDLFAGIGGFRHGMELAGHRCVGFCEFDKYAAASYTSMHLLTEKQRRYIESIPALPKKNGEPNFTKRQREIWKEEYRNGEWFASNIRLVDAGSMQLNRTTLETVSGMNTALVSLTRQLHGCRCWRRIGQKEENNE